MRGGQNQTKRNGCPDGYILRKGYTRKYRSSLAQSGFTVRRKGKLYTVKPKVQSIHVPAGCIKNRGLPGKGTASGKTIAPLRKGELRKHGYIFRLGSDERHSALKKAVKVFGALGVYRKLNAVAKLSKRTAPDASKVFKADREWVKKTYGPLKA